MHVVLVKSLWAASIDGHVGYSGSLPYILLVVIKFCFVLFIILYLCC